MFSKLFEKLEVERKALGGRVFDILGEVFDGVSLRDLLIEAIRYGEDPARQAHVREVVAGALETEKLREIISRNALAEEVMDERRLFALKEEMEKAEARKLQPFFIRSFSRRPSNAWAATCALAARGDTRSRSFPRSSASATVSSRARSPQPEPSRHQIRASLL